MRIILNWSGASDSPSYVVHDLIPLATLRPGQCAELRQIVGPADEVRRLEELGLRSGTSLEMVRAGSPCIVRVGGTKLCFRDGELLAVLVAPRKSA